MPSGKEIKSTQRKEQRVLIAIDTTAPTISVGGFKASAVRNGVGDISITLNLENKLVRNAVLVKVTSDQANIIGYAENATVSGFDLKTTDLAGTAADGKVICEVVGWYSIDEQ